MPASIAWPKVWPKLRMARRPDSRSSWPTTQALISHDRFTACNSAALSRANRAVSCWSIQSRKPASAIGPVLDHLGQPGGDLARRQRVQRVQVGHHPQRLVEGADHVLAQRVVDRRFAAHRRIHLRQQRGGHLHEGHAAHVAGRREAGQVPDHAAAEGEQDGAPVAAVLQQGVEDEVQRGPVLVGLAVGQLDPQHVGIVRGQRRLEPRRVQAAHGPVGDDHRMPGLRQAGEAGRVVEQAGADQDVVAALVQVDAHAFTVEGSWPKFTARPVQPAAAPQRGPGRGFDRRGHVAGVDDTGQLELHQDHVHQRRHRRAAGLDDEVRGGPVQRIALGLQLAQLGQRIAHLQQRPLVSCRRRRNSSSGDERRYTTVLASCRIRRLASRSTAPPPVAITQRGSRHSSAMTVCFDVRGRRLRPRGRRSRGCCSGSAARCDVVAVDEVPVQPPGQVSPDGGLAAAGQTHQGDAHDGLVSWGCRRGWCRRG